MSFVFISVLGLLMIVFFISVGNSVGNRTVRDRVVDIIDSVVIFLMILGWLYVFYKGGLL